MKPPVDVKKIMDEIKLGAIEYLAKTEPQQNHNSGSSVVHSEELNYLNHNWSNFASKQDIRSHRGKIIGTIITKAKKFIISTVEEYVLKGYFDRERNFNRNLVSYLNKNIKYTDDQHRKLFSAIHEKIDHEVLGILDRCDLVTLEAFTRVKEELHELEERIKKLESQRS